MENRVGTLFFQVRAGGDSPYSGYDWCLFFYNVYSNKMKFKTFSQGGGKLPLWQKKKLTTNVVNKENSIESNQNKDGGNHASY